MIELNRSNLDTNAQNTDEMRMDYTDRFDFKLTR